MDTQNLKAFLSVAAQGSFSQAAHLLHLTQPAVSKRVAALEEELGQALFHRINRRVELTQAGVMLQQRALTILQALEEARQALADLDGAVSGELKWPPATMWACTNCRPCCMNLSTATHG